MGFTEVLDVKECLGTWNSVLVERIWVNLSPHVSSSWGNLLCEFVTLGTIGSHIVEPVEVLEVLLRLKVLEVGGSHDHWCSLDGNWGKLDSGISHGWDVVISIPLGSGTDSLAGTFECATNILPEFKVLEVHLVVDWLFDLGKKAAYIPHLLFVLFFHLGDVLSIVVWQSVGWSVVSWNHSK